VTTFIMITMVEWMTGLGLLAMMRSKMPRSMSLPLALLIGMFVHSVIFLMTDVLQIGMGLNTMIASAIVGLVGTHLWWSRTKAFYTGLLARPKWTLTMYDMVTLWTALVAGFYVVWAAWYWPVTPFDAMAGIDLVARQAIEEGTIVNRVFTDESLRGFLSNQPFYAPFAMIMQIIYRLFGFGYGQVWLGVASVMFSWFMFSALRHVAHPFIAGVLWLLLLFTPEMLGYTYLLQTDYINAVFLGSAVVLLYLSVTHADFDALGASIVLFAAACWSRSETVGLVVLGLSASLWVLRTSLNDGRRWRYVAAASAASVGMFALWSILYVQVLLPVRPDITAEMRGLDLAVFSQVVTSFFANVVIDTELWGLTFILLVAALVLNVVAKRSTAPTLVLIWIGAVTVGLLIVGTLFTSAIVEQTLRRGIFKLIPLVFLYVAASPIASMLGERLNAWEHRR
jgi:hypothetical protein